MKRLLLIAFTTLSIHAIAQTNTFPSSGNVGIGTISPKAKLDVNGDAYINKLVTTGNNAIDPLTPYSADIVIGSDVGSRHNSSMMFWSDGSASRISGRNDVFSFSVWNTTNPNVSLAATVGANSFFQGSLGIGTTNPVYKLDVSGDVQFNGMFGYGLSETFTYKNTTVPHYGFRWNQDNWFSGGPTMLLSSYGGFKLFTMGVPRFFVTSNGNVGIKTENPQYDLDVLGTIRAKEVLVNLDGGADFVFDKGYKLLPIEHVASYVQENKHLPDIPSANEMVKNGVSMGDMQVKLLQKVEELTLYAIEQNKKIEQQNKKIEQLENSIKTYKMK